MYKYLFESLLSISGIAGKYVNSVFNFLGAVAVFFKALQYFTFPTAVPKGSNFPASLPTHTIFCFFDMIVSSHPNGLSLMTESSITGHDTGLGQKDDHNEWLLNGMPFGFNNTLNQISLTKAIFVTAQWWH